MNKTVSRDEWIEARIKLLEEEKAFTRQRDALRAKRMALPWMKVEKQYAFEGENGTASLVDLFRGKHQLVVYHLMYGPDWEAACHGCSFWADHFSPTVAHLAARDVSLVAVSRASMDQIRAWEHRMGWTFPWYSSAGNTFPYDFNASYTDEEVENKKAFHNFAFADPSMTDREGVSVFFHDDDGNVYLTYQSFARGIDLLNGTYNFLDICPKGRDEEGLSYPQAWVRFHDEYDAEPATHA